MIPQSKEIKNQKENRNGEGLIASSFLGTILSILYIFI